MFNIIDISENSNSDYKGGTVGGSLLGGYRGGFLSSPVDNMGVEIHESVFKPVAQWQYGLNPYSFNEVSWHIDFLTVTVWDTIDHFMDTIYKRNFALLGSLVELDHGFQFYKSAKQGLSGFSVLYNPHDGSDRLTVQMPGLICQVLGFEKIQDFVIDCFNLTKKVSISRFDIAFNGAPFTPIEFLNVLQDDLIYNRTEKRRVNSRVYRSKLQFINNPYELQEKNGYDTQNVGTSTVYWGSRSSTRYLRVYDKHGYTRVEVEYKGEKAKQVSMDVLFPDRDKGQTSYNIAMGHLLDYIDIDGWEAWNLFKGDNDRLYKKLPKFIEEVTLEKMSAWAFKQVSVALSILQDSDIRQGIIDEILEAGRFRRIKSRRHKELLRCLCLSVEPC